MSKEPKEIWGKDSPWKTQSEFYVWLRGLLRRGWSKHPLKITKLKKSRFRADKILKNGKKTQVWHCRCEICNTSGSQSLFEVDHIIPAGSLRSFDDLPGFILRLLYVKEEDLRILCKQCNSILAYADKQGVPFEEAKATKEAIRLVAAKQDKVWLQDRGITPASTITQRRKQIIEILLTTPM